MSLFKTVLPTETQAFLDELAKNKRTTLQGVSLTPEHQIVVIWETDDLFTGLTVPVDYPANMLRAGKLPAKVCKASEKPKAPVTPPAKQNSPQPIVAPLRAPVYLTEDALREAVAKGEKVEFQGVEPRWLPFDPKNSKFVEGFYYRVKQKPVDQKPVVA